MKTLAPSKADGALNAKQRRHALKMIISASRPKRIAHLSAIRRKDNDSYKWLKNRLLDINPLYQEHFDAVEDSDV